VEIIRVDEMWLQIRQIDALYAEMLHRIPSAADPGGDKITQDRLFINPMADDDEFNEDWRANVTPELGDLFRSAVETVSSDLEKLAETSDDDASSYSLSIPIAHLDQWINALNQARMVIASKNRFTEEDLNQGFSLFIESERDLSLLQMSVYEEMQYFLLREYR
jgi:hypothetical protein